MNQSPQNRAQRQRKAPHQFYSSRFETYRDLWKSLQGLRLAGDVLWKRASLANIIDFANQVRETAIKVDEGAIFFDESDYLELRALLEALGHFKMGKYRLLEINSHTNSERIDTKIARDQIMTNQRYKQEYESLLDRIRISFRERLSDSD